MSEENDHPELDPKDLEKLSGGAATDPLTAGYLPQTAPADPAPVRPASD